jgi:SAM-dependent methyltransferase
VLDIGCGTGRTTRQAARLAADGSALGVDLSSAMIARARLRAAEEGLSNVRFERADAQIAAFPPAGFDVAISRTGAMFFGDPVAAFGNIAAALRPGGRLALLVWQSLADNRWMVEFAGALAAGRPLPSPPPGAPGPFSLADPARVRAVLTAGGFTDVALEGAREPMDFGADADAAFRFVSGLGIVRFLLRDLGDGARERALDALRASIDAHAGPDGVRYPSAAWVVTARRT